jgi:hypothetical protein
MPVVLAGSDACLKIDDTQIQAGTIEFGQRIAPYVIGRVIAPFTLSASVR